MWIALLGVGVFGLQRYDNFSNRQEKCIGWLDEYAKKQQGGRMAALHFGCHLLTYLYSARMPGTRSGVRRP